MIGRTTQVATSAWSALRALTVEPAMLADGACLQAMLLYAENVQMNKICTVKMGYPSEVCQNLSAYEEHNVAVQRELTLFIFYNSIILSVLPSIYVLFMGAWSDKYSRKIPLIIPLVCRLLNAGGYFLVNWQTAWPVELLYVVTFLAAFGGYTPGIVASSLSYISDVSRENDRTSRLSTATSLWYLGGPIGTLLAAVVIRDGDYSLAIGLVLLTYIGTIMYVVVFIRETLNNNKTQTSKTQQPQDALTDNNVSFGAMVKDFFNWHRVLESFKTAFKRREGNMRAVLLVVLVANMARSVARVFFIYQFTRQVLKWGASDYGYWITYRNLLVALGSLVVVPLLTSKFSFTDTSLIVLGTGSLILEYLLYGLTSDEFAVLMWLAPVAGVLSNAAFIACKSIATKLVTCQEKGRINALSSALSSLMPMVGYAVYSPIYYYTVDTFPAAQFYFGASLNLLIMVTFIAMRSAHVSESYNIEALEKDGEGQEHTTGLKRCSVVTLRVIVNKIRVHEDKEEIKTHSPQQSTEQTTTELYI